MKPISTFLASPSAQAKGVGWEVLGDLTNLLTIATESFSELPFQGAFAGPAELLKAFESKHANTKGMNDILTQVSHLFDVVLMPLSEAKTSGIPISDAVQRRVDKLKIDFDEILDHLKTYEDRGAVRQLLSNREITVALTETNAKITAAMNECLLVGSIWTQVQVGDIRDQALLDILPYAAQARYNSSSRSFAPICLPGTRKDLLQRIYDWATSPDTKPIFWLSGLAGTGKSTIAQTISEHFANHQMLGASFFFSQQEATCNNPSLVFPTIAHQLSLLDSSFRQQLVALLRTNPDAGSASLQHQLQKLIAEPFCNLPPTTTSLIIVIDALDEGGEGAEALLPLLAPWLSRFPQPLKVFVTSRAEPKIRIRFGSPLMAPLLSQFELHKIEDSIVQADIQHFLTHELSQVAKDMLGDTHWPSQGELVELATKAGTLFIYASTSIKFIKNDEWHDPRSQLQTLLSKKAGKGPSPFQEIDQLYLQVLHSAITAAQDSPLYDRFQKVVGTIILLEDNVPVSSLATLLGIQQEIIFATVAKLHAVFTIPSTSNGNQEAIRALHPSFPEFLTDPLRCSDGQFYINKRRHHSNLAQFCLQHMLFHLHQDICDIQDPSKLNSEVDDIKYRLLTHIPPDLQYSCLHWAKHLIHASETDTLLQLFKEFCSEKLLYWLEVLSLLGHLKLAIPALKVAKQWIYKDHFFHQLLHDAHRFVLEFYDLISASAAHIYSSALSFAPDCHLYTIYQKQLSSSVRVVKGQQKTWHPCERVIEGHLNWAYCVAFSPDSTQIASGSWDHTVQLWDSMTGTSLVVLNGHSSSVYTVAFSPNGRQLASGSSDHSVYIWDTITGTSIAVLQSHSGTVYAVKFLPDATYCISGCSHGTICVWDTTSGTLVYMLEGKLGSINCINFSADCGQAVSGNDNGEIHVWETTEGSLLRRFISHSDWVNCVAFSSDGKYIISGSDKGTVDIWDSETGFCHASLVEEIKSVNSVASSPDGTHVICGLRNHTILLWEISSKLLRGKFIGHSASVYAVAFSKDGTQVVSGSADTTVRLWDIMIATSPATFNLQQDSDIFTSMAFSPTGMHIATGSEEGIIQIWNLQTSSLLLSVNGQSGKVRSVAFSPNGTHLASASKHRTLHLWDVRTGVCLATRQGSYGTAAFLSVNFLPNGTQIVSDAYDGTMGIWEPSTGTYTAAPLNVSASFSELPNSDSLQLGKDGWIVKSSNQRICWVPAIYRTPSLQPLVFTSHGNYCAILHERKFIILEFPSLM